MQGLDMMGSARTLIASLSILFVHPEVTQAEYFSNMGGGGKAINSDTSAKAFAGLAQVMTGLSKLELANADEAKANFVAATGTLQTAAKEFETLSQKYRDEPLE